MSISGNFTNPYGNYSTGSIGSAGSPDSTGSSSDVKFSNYTPNAGGATEQPKSGGGIGGFFKGIFNGAKNAVHSLFTPKGLLMAGAGLAACIAFPVAAPLVLGGLAVTAGGAKMYSSMKNGDAEGAGEGFFTAGTGALGAWGSGALSAAKAGSAGSAGADAAEAGSSSSSSSSGIMGSIKSGWNKFTGFFSSKPKTTEPAATEPPSGGLPTSPTTPNSPNGPRPAYSVRTYDRNGNVSYGQAKWVQSYDRNGNVVYNRAPANTTGSAATTEDTATSTTADAATKPKMFQGARDNFSNTYNYIKTPQEPFIGPMPEGVTRPGTNIFSRTGQVLTGKATNPDGTPILAGKPIWSLPTSTALAGGLPQGQQAG